MLKYLKDSTMFRALRNFFKKEKISKSKEEKAPLACKGNPRLPSQVSYATSTEHVSQSPVYLSPSLSDSSESWSSSDCGSSSSSDSGGCSSGD